VKTDRNRIQVFISYRREGGAELARLVWEGLNRRGYHAFMDVEDLRSGCFNEALYARIDSCSDLVVILTPKSLERCAQEDDWLRREVSHGIRKDKNIVPVMARGFQWPAPGSLPPDLADLPGFQGISHSHDLFEASMDRLATMLVARPARGRDRLLLAVTTLCLLLLALTVGVQWRIRTVAARSPAGRAAPSGPASHSPPDASLEPPLPAPDSAPAPAPVAEPEPPPAAPAAVEPASEGAVGFKSVADEKPPLDPTLEDRLYEVPHDFEVGLLTIDGQRQYEEGDHVTYRVKADRTCHIVVFCHQVDGSSVQLFPNAWNLDTLIAGGREVEVPGAAKAGFEIVVGPPFGTDVVQVVACSQASELHRVSAARARTSRPGPVMVSRGMVAKEVQSSMSEPSTSGSVAWSEAHLVIRTGPRGSGRSGQ
ncbi:MAG: DUF4384 domain-containing protein, partial [Verrucomicrobiota bacterium]